MQVSAASTYSTREVRALSREQRQCLFEDEQSLGNGSADAGSYSYSNCLVRCRMEHMNKLCQCAPYFYPTGGPRRGRAATLRPHDRKMFGVTALLYLVRRPVL
jgi:hypothetical protein